MKKRIAVTMDEAVYEGLVRVVGRRKISAFLEKLARPHVVGDDLSAGYRAMGQDTAREQEALAWSEALLGDAAINGVQIPINSTAITSYWQGR